MPGADLCCKPTEEGNGFQIAGPDSVFRDAKVSVQGKTLIVWHPAISDPQAVRYAFTNTAKRNAVQQGRIAGIFVPNGCLAEVTTTVWQENSRAHPARRDGLCAFTRALRRARAVCGYSFSMDLRMSEPGCGGLVCIA